MTNKERYDKTVDEKRTSIPLVLKTAEMSQTMTCDDVFSASKKEKKKPN